MPTLKTGYEQLVERLNRFHQGAPPSDLLYAILKMLFTEKEAKLVSLLPIKPRSRPRRVTLAGDGQWHTSAAPSLNGVAAQAQKGLTLN